MKKYVNIFSVLMLIVYGTFTLVAVPLHHHSQENVGTTKHSNTHASHDCAVCSFASTSILFQPSVHSVVVVEYAEKIYFADYKNKLASVFSKEFPRRGPPVSIS